MKTKFSITVITATLIILLSSCISEHGTDLFALCQRVNSGSETPIITPESFYYDESNKEMCTYISYGESENELILLRIAPDEKSRIAECHIVCPGVPDENEAMTKLICKILTAFSSDTHEKVADIIAESKDAISDNAEYKITQTEFGCVITCKKTDKYNYSIESEATALSAKSATLPETNS